MINVDELDKMIEEEQMEMVSYCNDLNAMKATRSTSIMDLRRMAVFDTQVHMQINRVLSNDNIDNDTKVQVIERILKVTNDLVEEN